MSKMLVTTGIFPPSVGGPATYSKLILDELPKRGVNVSVLSFDEVRHLPKFIKHLVFLWKVVFKSKGSSIIYAQDTVSVGLISACVAKLFGKKFWLRVPGDYAWEQGRQRFGVTDSIDEFQKKKYSFRVEFLRGIQKFVANRADTIVVPSEYFLQLVSGWVRNPTKVKRIYNGIKLINIKSVVGQKKIIFSSGRLVPWKGFKILIEAVLELRDKYPDIELRIAGDGPERDSLSWINGNGMVKFLGFLSKKEIQNELSQASIYALNTGFESFSFAVVEAMWAGVPVVTTNVGNLKEIIDNGENGLLVSYNSKEEFVSAIDKLLSDRKYADRISKEGKKKAEMFSVEKTLDELVKLIENESNQH